MPRPPATLTTGRSLPLVTASVLAGAATLGALIAGRARVTGKGDP